MTERASISMEDEYGVAPADRQDVIRFLHFHGGTGCGSTHKPLLASRASRSNPSSTVSLRATSDTTTNSWRAGHHDTIAP